MLLLFTVQTALTGLVTLLDMKVKLPVVFVVIFVKVLPLIVVFKYAIAFEITVKVPLDATEQVKSVKLFELMLIEEVALPVVDSTTMPCNVAETPCVNEIVLLVMLFVKVPDGANEKAGTKIALIVPAVAPPSELVIEL